METQLDSVGQTPLLNRFLLLGSDERRSGGAAPCHTLQDVQPACRALMVNTCSDFKRCLAICHLLAGALKPRTSLTPRSATTGQAVVQFARGVRDGGQYALKFFLNPRDFRSEKAVYSDSPLGELLPLHYGLYDNEDGVLMDSFGNNLPPCIVMEKGESLDEWTRRRKPDVWAAMPVRSGFKYMCSTGSGTRHAGLLDPFNWRRPLLSYYSSP